MREIFQQGYNLLNAYLVNMNYLSIDFSTTATGYAYKQNGEYIVGVIKGGKGSAWERTAQIAETIKEMIIEDSLQNYHIVIEQPINVRNKKTAITLANCNGMLLGMLQAVTDGFTFIPNSSWASFHLIGGKRTERKEQSKAILLHDLGLDLGDDEADAYCQLKYVESLEK